MYYQGAKPTQWMIRNENYMRVNKWNTTTWFIAVKVQENYMNHPTTLSDLKITPCSHKIT
jgi:hypothetical protein